MSRIIDHTNNLTPSERYCTSCGRPLNGRFAWLELDQRTNTYHDKGAVPADKSQGFFAFGLDCAKRLRKEAGK